MRFHGGATEKDKISIRGFVCLSVHWLVHWFVRPSVNGFFNRKKQMKMVINNRQTFYKEQIGSKSIGSIRQNLHMSVKV